MKIMIQNISISVLSLIISILLFEGFLVLKNSLYLNYDIEMWKYSKYLKEKSQNIKIGHIHKKNSIAKLQDVVIRTNEYGMRGEDVSTFNGQNFDRRVMLIGSSIALGWGVKEEEHIPALIEILAKNDDQKWLVYNAGVGNYNAERYVNNYLTNLSEIDVDTIIILFFVNDTEVLLNNEGNIFTRNFQTAVLAWKYISSLGEKVGLSDLEIYYKEKYNENDKGYLAAKNSLITMQNFCKEKDKKCVLAMMPDIHSLNPYNLGFIHDKVKRLAENVGLDYIDLLPLFEGFKGQKLWNKYNDPHPNAFAHEISAKKLYQVIK